MKKVLQINRKGSFIANPGQATDHQCVVEGHHIYFYECRVKLTNPELDSRGFIVDHEEINSIIQTVVSGPIPSCELLSSAMAIAVSDYLTGKSIKHDEVYVRLSGQPEPHTAFIEAWAYPEETTPQSDTSIGTPGIEEYRLLSLDELKAITTNRDGGYRHGTKKGYVTYQEIKIWQPYTLSEDEVSVWKAKKRAEGSSYVRIYRAENYIDVPLWAVVPKNPQVTTEAPTEEPKVLRILTSKEIEAIAETGRHEVSSRWYLKEESIGNDTAYLSNSEKEGFNGRPLTDSELQDYENTKRSKGTYAEIKLWPDNVSVSTPLWAITDAPLPPEPKPRYRMMSLLEAAIKHGSEVKDRSGDLEHVTKGEGYWFTTSMDKGYNKRELTEEEVESLLKNGNVRMKTREDGARYTVYPWMVTEIEPEG